MDKSIAELHQEIQIDPWREEAGFTSELGEANVKLFTSDSATCEVVINDWLGRGKNQPCLFGKTAAKLGLITYCILTESDLQQSDEMIQKKIQAARKHWTREGFLGRKSGFVILAVSRRIALGTPGATMQQLAMRLCSLYLLEEIHLSQIYMDELFLEKPGMLNSTWKWKAGVNYFCAQGDKRWWHDHRIPGGMAFSVNSVGHMVKSGKLAAVMKQLEAALAASEEGWDASAIDSLEKALTFAMRTIKNAAETLSGRATRLLPIPELPETLPVPKCPFEIPTDMADRNYCEYAGYYHTDFTLPAEYFLPDVERPVSIREHKLDFTYLFHDHISNPAFITMGDGQPIRSDEGESSEMKNGKERKASAESSLISSNPRLIEALEG